MLHPSKRQALTHGGGIDLGPLDLPNGVGPPAAGLTLVLFLFLLF